MTNILEAIVNIVQNPINEIKSHYTSKNRVNNVGEALEYFVKDAFANCIHEEIEERLEKYNEVFSWLGNQNHPPDIMIKGGDVIEVKKTQSLKSDLALNSSYPKSTLKSDSLMITKSCKNCEKWTEKDLIYCVGHTTDNSVKSLWFVYGEIYAAEHETYEIIKNKITQGINEIPNVELSETKELGRVNRVDPLGITNLRIRGMWQIQNPRKVFEYIYDSNSELSFELVAIIPTRKYNNFPIDSINKIENIDYLDIKDVKVKNPNNPARLIECKLIVYNK
ncbi:NgoPII family restriction endonuclease [Ornithobacterium rhinotracheale]